MKIVRNKKNLGFVGACNAGAEAARGELIYFLNNDTLVQDEWLDALCDTFEDPTVGVAGSRLLFGEGKLQECGGIIWRDGSGWNWGREQDAKNPDYRYLRDADYVSGAALMVRALLFRKLGGFDALYEPAYYEDTDLCFRVREAGYRVVVQPASTIVHLEGRSNGTDLGSGLKKYQVVNHTKFYRRWSDILKSHRSNGDTPWLEAQRQVKRRALFVDETAPTPDQDAGSNVAYQHMRSLQRLGYHLVFSPCDNMADIPLYTAALEKIGIECVYAPYYYSLEDYFRRRPQKFDVVYLHRFNNANRYMELVRRFQPDARILYNVADLHFLRELRERELGLQGVNRRGVSAKRELDLIADADAAIVHSEVEWQLAREQRPDANVHCLVWPFRCATRIRGFEERSDIGFVGGKICRAISLIDGLGVSIDGATKESFESIRVGGNFERFLANVREIVAIRAETGNPSLMEFSFTAMTTNLPELPGVVRIAAEIGVPNVYFQPMEMREPEIAARVGRFNLMNMPREEIFNVTDEATRCWRRPAARDATAPWQSTTSPYRFQRRSAHSAASFALGAFTVGHLYGSVVQNLLSDSRSRRSVCRRRRVEQLGSIVKRSRSKSTHVSRVKIKLPTPLLQDHDLTVA